MRRKRPKPDGSPGFVITPDPEQKSFKQAIVCIAFAGMWFEALVHLVMVDHFGEEVANDWDRRSYRNKFEKLGCKDQEILDQIQRFADSRNDLMHEKAHWNQDHFTTAQKEAEGAIEFIKIVSEFIETMSSSQQARCSGSRNLAR